MSDFHKTQPIAVCTVCGAFGHTRQYIGERCGKPYGGRRCNGIRARADNKDDWKPCMGCESTGRQGGDECLVCNGEGWLYIRRTQTA